MGLADRRAALTEEALLDGFDDAAVEPMNVLAYHESLGESTNRLLIPVNTRLTRAGLASAYDENRALRHHSPRQAHFWPEVMLARPPKYGQRTSGMLTEPSAF